MLRTKKKFKHSSTFYRKLKKYSTCNVTNVSASGSSTMEQSIAQRPIDIEKNDTSVDSRVNPQLFRSLERNVNATDPSKDQVDEVVLETDVTHELRRWALKHNISHFALTDLLTLLKHRGLAVPTSSRTLLHTPRHCSIFPMGNGEMWYNGIKNNLISSLSNEGETRESVSLIFNIDGLPPFKSSRLQFWPILLKIHEYPSHQPIVVAIYCGESKPPLQEFLEQFVIELNEILATGFQINEIVVKVLIKYFVCDTPERNFILGTVYFNAAHGCLKCTVTGEYDKGGRHMTFVKTDCPLRTDDSFRRTIDEDHHKEESPLTKLPIDMVEDIIIADSLHYLDLGVMKKCLYGWVYGNYNFKTKLSGRYIELLSEKLKLCNIRKPTEIHRAIRPIKNLKDWKGTEFRTFLLYLGPVVLKDILASPIYHNYLLLFCATTILSCKAYLKYIGIAETLLLDFIETFGNLYGFDGISSNVHSLCHIVNDVKKFGPLSEISTYPFENFLSHLKPLVRTGSRPLAQIAKRVIELQNSSNNFASDEHRIFTPYVKYESPEQNHELPDCNKIFNVVYLAETMMLSNSIKDMWFLAKDNTVVRLINITYCKSEICVYGTALKNYKDFFDLPIKSSRLNIYECNYKNADDYSKARLFALNDIKCKLFALEYGESLVFFPLLHTLDIMTI